MPSQRLTYFPNTLRYGELLSLKSTQSQILVLYKLDWNFAISTNGASSCVDFMSTNPDKENSFSTSIQVEVFMLTSKGFGCFFPWIGKCQPFCMIFIIALAPTFLKSWYNNQSDYIMAFCILHNSLLVKLLSHTLANYMIFFFCNAATLL